MSLCKSFRTCGRFESVIRGSLSTIFSIIASTSVLFSGHRVRFYANTAHVSATIKETMHASSVASLHDLLLHLLHIPTMLKAQNSSHDNTKGIVSDSSCIISSVFSKLLLNRNHRDTLREKTMNIYLRHFPCDVQNLRLDTCAVIEWNQSTCARMSGGSSENFLCNGDLDDFFHVCVVSIAQNNLAQCHSQSTQNSSCTVICCTVRSNSCDNSSVKQNDTIFLQIIETIESCAKLAVQEDSSVNRGLSSEVSVKFHRSEAHGDEMLTLWTNQEGRWSFVSRPHGSRTPE